MAQETTKLATKAVEDVCPECGIEGENHFDYGDRDWPSGTDMCQEVTCKECDLDFKQWYKVQFNGQQVGEIDIPIYFPVLIKQQAKIDSLEAENEQVKGLIAGNLKQIGELKHYLHERGIDSLEAERVIASLEAEKAELWEVSRRLVTLYDALDADGSITLEDGLKIVDGRNAILITINKEVRAAITKADPKQPKEE